MDVCPFVYLCFVFKLQCTNCNPLNIMKNKTWYVGTVLNIKTGKSYVVTSIHFEDIDELEASLTEDEVMFKNDNSTDGE